MINKELFYAITGQSRDVYMKPAPRLVAHSKATANIFITEGYAAEFYSMDGISKMYSWFYGKGEFMIPTSGYSNIVLSDDGAYSENNYSKMIRELRSKDEIRAMYKGIREQHDKAIAERIKEIRSCSPMEQYISLVTKKPWVLERVPQTDIASYLSISVSELQKFSQMSA